MEIHGPEGPTNSFKDFAIHIVIVTIGILIALGLEGIRESIYEHRIVRDAREAGALAIIPRALAYRARGHVLAGEFTTAALSDT